MQLLGEVYLILIVIAFNILLLNLIIAILANTYNIFDSRSNGLFLSKILATRDELLIGGRRGMEYDEDMIIDKEIASLLSNGVYPPIFHKFRSIGLFVIRIFKNFKWIYVIIDERIPVDIKSKQPVFGKCRDPHEMWVALIEKAYAKMHGCYENLISGYVDEGI